MKFFVYALLFNILLGSCSGYFSREEVTELPGKQDSFRTGILRYLDDQIEMNPEEVSLYIEKAGYLKDEGWPNSALPVLNTAIALDSNNNKAYSLREAFFLSKGRYKDALRDIAVLEERGILTDNLINDKIEALYGRQDYQDFFSAAVANAAILNRRNKLNFSKYYLSRGDSLLAIRYGYLSFLEDSLQSNSVLKLANLLIDKGFAEKSLMVLSKGQSADPAYELTRAEILMQLDEREEALQVIKDLTDQGDTTALSKLNEYFQTTGQIDSAIYYNDRHMIGNDTTISLLKKQALLYQERFYWSKALEFLNLVIKKDPSDEEAQSEASKVRGKIAYLRNLKAQRDSIPQSDSNNP
ncbi:MAG: hypothetical protein WBA74_19355 [Cyclobacteriaceae bacterium]